MSACLLRFTSRAQTAKRKAAPFPPVCSHLLMATASDWSDQLSALVTGVRQADNAQLFAGLGLFFLVVHIFFMRPRQALRTAVTATPPDPTDHLKNVLPGVLEQNAARDAE